MDKIPLLKLPGGHEPTWLIGDGTWVILMAQVIFQMVQMDSIFGHLHPLCLTCFDGKTPCFPEEDRG
jgi:hypothetical protein